MILLVGVLGLATAASAAPPGNDNFAFAQSLGSATSPLAATNVDATKEPGEPDHAGNAGGASIWFQWTPLASGPVYLDTAGSGVEDTVLAVYTGGSVGDLTPVATNDDGDGYHARACFVAMAGTLYRIAVDGFDGETGTITLAWGQETSGEPCGTTPPEISGPLLAGQTLTGTAGTWTGSPAVFRYQWHRCVGAVCAAIAGETSASYTTVPSDVGTALRLAVLAENAVGSTVGLSLPTSAVGMVPAIRANGPIAWESTRDGNFEIWSMAPDGSDVVNLTSSPLSYDTFPSWSDDGARLVFTRSVGGGLPYPHVMNADGSGQSSLGPYGSQATWSPDGSRIAYREGRGMGDVIKVVNADGTGLTTLFEGVGVGMYDLDWSPDGTEIAFAYWTTGATSLDLYVVPAAGGEAVPLTAVNTSANEYNAAWSPDGTRLAFVRSTANQADVSDGDIWVYDGTTVTRLTTDPAHDEFPSFSPDGTMIVFDRRVSITESDLFVMDAAGGNERQLTFESGHDHAPEWGAAFEPFTPQPPPPPPPPLSPPPPPAAAPTPPPPAPAPPREPQGPTGVRKRGSAAADVLRGTPYADRLLGLGGDDRLLGGGGDDLLDGGRGADRILGGAGRDQLVGGPGLDTGDGGPGADALRMRDGVRDVVRCGAGRDRATVDRVDRVIGCEVVRRA